MRDLNELEKNLFSVADLGFPRRGPGADPGFPVGGGANPLAGAPTYDFAKFCEKLHEIEKILGRRGGTGRAPLNPPLGGGKS